MNKLQKLHEFLTELQKGVQDKFNAEEKQIYPHRNEVLDETLNEFLTHSHTEGQLYEINYILDNFWRIINEE